jgi:hypothetical protein
MSNHLKETMDDFKETIADDGIENTLDIMINLAEFKQTIDDYGIENSLDAMINLIETKSLNEWHKTVILAYLMASKNYISGLGSRQKFLLEGF